MSASCENCVQLAEQNDALQKRAVDEFEKREAVVSRLAKADREIGGLKGELTKLRTDSPRMKDAEEVFRFWQTRLHKNARTNFGPKRQEKVLARLKEKSSHADIDRKADLKWAVRGCEAMPWSANFQRYAEPGPGRKKKDDLAIVCFDETSIERFMGYADDRADHVFSKFVEALVDGFGERVDVVEEFESVARNQPAGKPIMVVSSCPVCEDDWALTAFPGRAPFGELLVVECHVNGCSSDEVLSGLRALAEEKAA